MNPQKIPKKIKKRDGRVVPFDPQKITTAVFKAGQATGEFDQKEASRLSDLVVSEIVKRGFDGKQATVEEVQDIVEETLMKEGYFKTAKAYILYRELHRRARELESLVDVNKLIGGYLDRLDWRVRENANMTYSLQGLNIHVSTAVSTKYWLNQLYGPEAKEAHENGDLHIHDLYLLAPYCCGWELRDFLLKGFGGVPGKIESKPPKHLKVALGQLVNFLYTLQGENAGAEAVSNFDTLLAPFIRYDGLNYKEVKQAMQEFLFNINVPTRVGFQTPFTNVTLDLKVPHYMRDEPVIVGGKPQEKTYGDFQKEIDMFNKAFAEVMLEGDAKGRVFTFPIPTYNVTPDLFEDNGNLDAVWEMTAKYGIPYFANFINSDMKPEDARAMCCRLRLDNRQLRKRGGGFFGANPLTGSIGVVTINLPRIGYLSKNEKEFFERLGNLMEIARQSLIAKRRVVEKFTEGGLYPYSKVLLSKIKEGFGKYWYNHFSTVGIIGGNEACVNFLGKDIATPEGQKFMRKVLDFMNEKLRNFQAKDDQMYNLEATPAEGTSYRLAQIDKEKYPEIAAPYYTNSTQLPVGFTDDLFEALDSQDALQCQYTGGCIEKGNKVLTNKGLLPIEYIVKNFKKLKPIKVASYNAEKGVSEWDEIVEAVSIDVKKHDKIRIKGERNLDIVTSDWHPFFVLEEFKPRHICPICKKAVKNIKAFATHLRWNAECREKYRIFPKHQIVEKRADELKVGDYILQNPYNLYSGKEAELNRDLMWLVGFFIGDGCISEFIDNRGGNNLKKYKVRFFSEHQEPLEKIAKILNQYFGCRVSVIENEKRGNKLLKEVSTSKKIVSEFFFNYGFEAGEKKYTAAIPQRVKENIRKSNVYSLLSGLMDSDGHIDKSQGDFEYYTVSPQLADDILEVCSRAGIMISKTEKFTKRENEVNIYRLRIPAHQMIRIKNKLTNVVHRSRIKENLSNRKKRYLPVVRVQGVSKVDVEDSQFYDLMTKKNHNYLAGKNTLVFIHNTVFHAFLGERLPSGKVVKKLVEKIAKNYRLPYFTLTPTFSICMEHGYLSGEHPKCPKCGKECEVYSRVVGYLRPVNQWNTGKRAEFKERKEFKV